MLAFDMWASPVIRLGSTVLRSGWFGNLDDELNASGLISIEYRFERASG